MTLVDGVVGIDSSGSAISLTETAGNVTLSQAVNAGASSVLIALSADDTLLTNNTVVSGTAGVTLRADKMTLNAPVR